MSLLSSYKKGARLPAAGPAEGEVRAEETAECCRDEIGNISEEVGDEEDMEDTGVRNGPLPLLKLPEIYRMTVACE